MLSRDDRSDSDLTSSLDGLDGLDTLGGPFGRGLDERTEIILAATFLVLIILAFIRLVHDFCLLISIVIRCGLIFWPLQIIILIVASVASSSPGHAYCIWRLS